MNVHLLLVWAMYAQFCHILGVLCTHCDLNSETKISNYERLRKDILSRPVVVHKIPPDVIHEDVQSYKLSFRLWLLDVYDIDELNQVQSVVQGLYVAW